MTQQELLELLYTRWVYAQKVLNHLTYITVTWDIGASELFKAKRCNASTTGDGSQTCHIRFPPRILDHPLHRVDGVIRHEIGHVVDITVCSMDVDIWADSRGVSLPYTPERRADAIALAIWGEPILYDSDMVQSIRHGKPLRPESIGL